MSGRYLTKKVLGSLATLFFVICFNFFLFRIVEGDPVANLFRGRNITASQRADLTRQFGLDKSTGGQFLFVLTSSFQRILSRQTATLEADRNSF